MSEAIPEDLMQAAREIAHLYEKFANKGGGINAIARALMAQRARQEERVRVMEEALRRLADAVGASKVPQTPDEAMVQVLLTVGPALTNARAALGNGRTSGKSDRTAGEGGRRKP